MSLVAAKYARRIWPQRYDRGRAHTAASPPKHTLRYAAEPRGHAPACAHGCRRACALRRNCGRTPVLGVLAHWPGLTRPRLAGFQVSTEGEAAARLSSALREDHPEIPWLRVIGMRNVLVHGYFAIDPEEVWVTVDRRVPALRRQIEAILQGHPSGETPSVSERHRAYQLIPQ